MEVLANEYGEPLQCIDCGAEAVDGHISEATGNFMARCAEHMATRIKASVKNFF